MRNLKIHRIVLFLFSAAGINPLEKITIPLERTEAGYHVFLLTEAGRGPPPLRPPPLGEITIPDGGFRSILLRSVLNFEIGPLNYVEIRINRNCPWGQDDFEAAVFLTQIVIQYVIELISLIKK